MRTSQGKLAVLGFLLLLACVLFAPMRSGEEDALRLEPDLLRMSVGDRYPLRAALSAEDMSQRIHFTSSNARVASVDSDGVVLGLWPGEAEIRARASEGASARMRVEVVGVPMTELRLNVDELQIEKGEYSGLSVRFNEDATDTRIMWISSDENVVRVDASGKVYGVGGGTAYVTALSSTGVRASARVRVDVAGTAAHITPNQLTLGVGARVPLKVSFLPLDCTDVVERWTSSDPDVLEVGSDGVLEACGEGSAYVTAVTKGGLTVGMEVRVEPAPSELRLDPASATLERGEALRLQLEFLEEDGGVEDPGHLVVWTSSDPSVASVDSDGNVTARKSGRCTVTATSDGMSVACQLNVQVNIQEIRLNRSEVYLLREDTDHPIQLEYVYAPVDPDDATITFASDNLQVATVNKYGLVEMTGGYGTAVITASAKSGAQAQFIVNVVTQLPEETGAPSPATGEAAQNAGEATANAGEATADAGGATSETPAATQASSEEAQESADAPEHASASDSTGASDSVDTAESAAAPEFDVEAHAEDETEGYMSVDPNAQTIWQ